MSSRHVRMCGDWRFTLEIHPTGTEAEMQQRKPKNRRSRDLRVDVVHRTCFPSNPDSLNCRQKLGKSATTTTTTTFPILLSLNSKLKNKLSNLSIYTASGVKTLPSGVVIHNCRKMSGFGIFVIKI